MPHDPFLHMLDVLRREYIHTARAKGLAERVVRLPRALRRTP